MIKDEAFLLNLRSMDKHHFNVKAWLIELIEKQRLPGKHFFCDLPLYLIENLRQEHALLPHTVGFIIAALFLLLMLFAPGFIFLILLILIFSGLISDYKLFKRQALYLESLKILGVDEYQYDSFGLKEAYEIEARLLTAPLPALEKFKGKSQGLSYLLYSLSSTAGLTYIKYGVRKYFAQIDLRTKADFQLMVCMDIGKFRNKFREESSGLKQITMENDAFENTFETYCNEEVEARKFLDVYVMENIQNLMKETSLSSLNFYIHDQHMDILFSIDSLSKPFNLRLPSELHPDVLIQKKHAIEFLFGLKGLLRA